MLTKIQIRTTAGIHNAAVSREERAALGRNGGVTEMVRTIGNRLGAADASDRLLFNVDGAGWVAFNPAHVVSIAFIGTEDGELYRHA